MVSGSASFNLDYLHSVNMQEDVILSSFKLPHYMLYML